MPLSEIILGDSGVTERRKDDMATRLLREYEPLALERDPRGYAVGFSGGKDSLVVKQLCKEAGVKHFCLYNVTGLDPPELVYFKRKKFAEYETEGVLCRSIMYQRNIVQLMRMKNMPPTRLVRYCCEHLKEATPPEYMSSVFSFGVRQMESASRLKRRDEMEVYHRRNTNKFAYDNHENRRNFEVCYAANPLGQIRINPIARGWSDGDVWDFIHDRRLEYCSLYDEGWTRLGCVGCPMAGQKRVREFERWPGLERIWRRGFDLMWEERLRRKAAGKEYIIEFHSVNEWWDWWMELTPRQEAQIVGQLELDCEP